MKKHSYIVLTILLLSVFLIVSCGGAATTTAPQSPGTTTTTTATKPPQTQAADTPHYGGTLRILEANFPGDPIGWMAEGTVWTAQWPAEESLIAEQVNGDFTPLLAESWEVNADDPTDATITIRLHKNVKYADGTDCTAETVKWNLEQVKAGGKNKSSASYWGDIEVIDDTTLVIHFAKWTNLAVRSLTNLPATAVSPTAFEKNGVEYMRFHMVGTGAFIQTDYQRDVKISFVKNPDYYIKGKPYLDGIEMYYVADEMTRLAMFQSGEADVMNIYSNPRQAIELEKAGYKILVRTLGPDILSPDSMHADSPWSSQLVREAAEYAIDKEAMAKTLGYGFREAAYQFAAKDDKAYVPTLGRRTYNVEKAKQLLIEAGYPDGFDSTLIAQNTVNKDTLTAIQGYLGEIGIRLEIQLMEPASYMATWVGEWNNAVMYNETIRYPIFNATMNIYFGPVPLNNKVVQRPDGWDELIKRSLAVATPEVGLMQAMNTALYDNATVIPITYGATMYAVTDKVHDTGFLTRGSTTAWNPQNAWLSP